MSDSLRPHGLEHTRPPCPSPTPRAYSNSVSMRWDWQCHLTISSSLVPFSCCLQSFPSSGSLQMSQFFTSGGQSTGVSASTSVLPMNIQDWSPLGWSPLGWIPLHPRDSQESFPAPKRQKDMTPKVELPRSVGAQYATGDQWRNNSRKNE